MEGSIWALVDIFVLQVERSVGFEVSFGLGAVAVELAKEQSPGLWQDQIHHLLSCEL